MPSHDASERGQTAWYLRHTWPIRLMHWINVLAFTLLLMSGLQIFNAYPALNWGKSSYTGRPPILQIGARMDAQGNPVGVTRIFGHEFNTTGVLGLSGRDGERVRRGFPAWITLPGQQWLAMGRRWHFFFAWVLVVNGLAYIAYTLASRHLTRDLMPTRSDWRSIGQSFKDHLLLRRAQGEADRRYNILQKLAYLSVIFALLPLLILMGWAMSPGLNALFPGWVDVFGGRQSARTIHFAVAWLLVGFAFIHLFEVVVSGFWNNLRSMVTGRYRVADEEDGHD
ncbi:MAG: cytochrome b/b6 domain-containing protein [Thiobacillus sp.]|jgi:thiosulfate reductase cytochrome b subunit|uniref:cytochrome b/b6 domain-containing protein n=1 Tax=Thiobacillus sp. TaxID=924 RepID=UPI0028944357|nr:cytochrome b/b6 domain-containing protein [Thiobacillus sp.]MDT3705614.1 cytochrome b/b6 domain-containing protein [Thiobacillus sp.]